MLKMEKAKSVSSEHKIKILEELKNAAIETTGHGLPRIMLSKSYFLKIMWTIFMLVSMSLCAYMIIRLVSQYLQFDVNTQILVIYEPKILFPTISYCNHNQLVTPAANEYLQRFYETTYNLSVSNVKVLWDYIVNGTVVYDNEYIMYLTYTPNFDFLGLNITQNDFGYGEKTLYYTYSSLIECNVTEQLETYFHPWWGSCVKFNGNKARPPCKVFRSSIGFYNTIFVGHGMGKSLDESSQFNRFYSTYQDGVLMFIDDYPITYSTGISVPAGTVANIGLSKTVTKNLPYPYSSCQDAAQVDTLLSREMKRHGYVQYTRDVCIVFCQQKLIIDRVCCYDARFPAILNAHQPCLTREQYSKASDIIDFADFSDECSSYCPFECETITHTASISYGALSWICIGQIDVDYINSIYGLNYSSCEDYENTFAIVDYYFEELKYTQISASPAMLLGDLIANIGGTLGLFVGVSVLSFVEILELGINIILLYYKKQKVDKEISKNQTFA
jgi:hypothetical protein